MPHHFARLLTAVLVATVSFLPVSSSPALAVGPNLSPPSWAQPPKQPPKVSNPVDTLKKGGGNAAKATKKAGGNAAKTTKKAGGDTAKATKKAGGDTAKVGKKAGGDTAKATKKTGGNVAKSAPVKSAQKAASVGPKVTVGAVKPPAVTGIQSGNIKVPQGVQTKTGQVVAGGKMLGHDVSQLGKTVGGQVAGGAKEAAPVVQKVGKGVGKSFAGGQKDIGTGEGAAKPSMKEPKNVPAGEQSGTGNQGEQPGTGNQGGFGPAKPGGFGSGNQDGSGTYPPDDDEERQSDEPASVAGASLKLVDGNPVPKAKGPAKAATQKSPKPTK